MKTFIHGVVANFIIYAFIWAGYIGYHWWDNGGLSDEYQDPTFYLILAGAMLVVSIVQTYVELREEREERRKLEGW